METAAPEGEAAVRAFGAGAVTIVVNGKPMDVPDGLSLEGLLAQLGVPRQFTAVAVNREVTPKSRYPETFLHEGDKIEIVRPMGGGAS